MASAKLSRCPRKYQRKPAGSPPHVRRLITERRLEDKDSGRDSMVDKQGLSLYVEKMKKLGSAKDGP